MRAIDMLKMQLCYELLNLSETTDAEKNLITILYNDEHITRIFDSVSPGMGEYLKGREN